MSKRAEERALEFYPEKDYNKEPNYLHTCDSKMLDKVYREVFILGYKQAEQDLALTAEDVSCIIHLADQFGKDYQRIADVFNKDRENETQQKV